MAKPLAVALTLWSLWFAVVHALWALGWRWGVPPEMPPIHTRPIFHAYDIVAGLAMLVLAGLGAFLTARPGQARSGLPRLALWVTAIACGLRFAIGAAGDVTTLVAGRGLSTVTWLADVWFGVTAVLTIALLRTSGPRNTSAVTP